MAVNLFSYQRGNSLLHKCNALAKVFFLTVFCIFIFVDAKWMSPFFIARTAACVFVPLLLLFLSGLSLRIFFNLWPVILTGVFVTAFRSFYFLPEISNEIFVFSTPITGISSTEGNKLSVSV